MEKKPFLTEEMAQAIIEDVPTPFHVYDEKGIRENARRINKAFSWNKGFKEYFAVKALPNPVILQILKEEGCGVDCSSLTELMLSEVCGFAGSDIMFSSNQTPVEDMQKAYELGAYINLDDATMVDFLDRVAGVPETVFCRYNPGGTFSLGESEEGFQVMDKPGDAKYGMTEEQMIDSYKKLMAKGAKHFGIHAFLASNTTANDYYPELASQLFRLAVRLRNATGCHFSFVNLSGGVGVDYRPEQPSSDIALIGEGVHMKYDEILVPAGMDDIAIFTELGRFMLAPYGHLISTVLHQKHIYREYVGLDACAANLMRPAMYGAYHHITVLGKEDAALDHVYDVIGGLCARQPQLDLHFRFSMFKPPLVRPRAAKPAAEPERSPQAPAKAPAEPQPLVWFVRYQGWSPRASGRASSAVRPPYPRRWGAAACFPARRAGIRAPAASRSPADGLRLMTIARISPRKLHKNVAHTAQTMVHPKTLQNVLPIFPPSPSTVLKFANPTQSNKVRCLLIVE